MNECYKCLNAGCMEVHMDGWRMLQCENYERRINISNDKRYYLDTHEDVPKHCLYFKKKEINDD